MFVPLRLLKQWLPAGPHAKIEELTLMTLSFGTECVHPAFEGSFNTVAKTVQVFWIK